MSPLAKELVEKLNNEEDTQVLAQVLDFYEYLKQKKIRNYKKSGQLLRKMMQMKNSYNIQFAKSTEKFIS